MSRTYYQSTHIYTHLANNYYMFGLSPITGGPAQPAHAVAPTLLRARTHTLMCCVLCVCMS